MPEESSVPPTEWQGALTQLAKQMEQLALSQQDLSARVEQHIRVAPRESEGSNASVQMSAMQEAITSLADVMRV